MSDNDYLKPEYVLQIKRRRKMFWLGVGEGRTTGSSLLYQKSESKNIDLSTDIKWVAYEESSVKSQETAQIEPSKYIILTVCGYQPGFDWVSNGSEEKSPETFRIHPFRRDFYCLLSTTSSRIKPSDGIVLDNRGDYSEGL